MIKKNKLELYFNKSLYRGTLVCTYVGAIGALLFTIKYIYSDYHPEVSLNREDAIGLCAGIFLFLLFFPMSTFLYFTNTLGKDFFTKNTHEK